MRALPRPERCHCRAGVVGPTERESHQPLDESRVERQRRSLPTLRYLRGGVAIEVRLEFLARRVVREFAVLLCLLVEVAVVSLRTLPRTARRGLRCSPIHDLTRD